MTEKKERIIEAALHLFAEEGFKATSTSKVARKAGVSEGLIFRHFQNKDGLLQAITAQGEEAAKQLFADIVLETDPKAVIRKTLQIGQKMNADKEMAHFWKLQYKIKWEMEQYGVHKIEPLFNALTHAFTRLGYKNPEREADLMITLIDGLAMRFFLQEDFDIQDLLNHLMNKYEL